MSLETLLEAAEFLESRGQGAEKRMRQSIERHISEPGTSTDGSDSNAIAMKLAKEGRPRTQSGSSMSMTPIYDGPSDNFFLRAGTREVHNKLEKNRLLETREKPIAPLFTEARNCFERSRRAHLKECFDFLKKNIPSLEDRRTSNLGILRSSLRYIQNLKRKEREFELEMHKFAHEKLLLQNRMHLLKSELDNLDIDIDFNAFVLLPDNDTDSNSTSTATERGTPPPSDHDEQDDDEEEAENLAMETNSPTPKISRKRKHSGVKRGVSNNSPTGQKQASASIDPLLVNGTFMNTSSVPILAMQRPILTMQTPVPKKVIPINLSLSGLVPSPSISVINAINPGPAAFEMSVTGKILEIPPVRAPVLQTVPMHTPIAPTALVRTPVTQILHRTLQQRQQQALLLSQRAAATTNALSKVSSAPLTAAQLKSPPLSQPTVTMATTQLAAQPTLIVKDGVLSSAKLLAGAASTAAGKMNITSGVPTMSIPYYMASLQKIAHPVLVTSLMTPAIGLQSTSAFVPSTSVVSALSSASPALSVKPISKAEPVGTLTLTNSNMRALNNLQTIALVASSPKMETPTTSSVATSVPAATIPIRPIFAPNMLPGQQLAWPFLTIPRSNVLVTTSIASQSSTMVCTATSQVTSHPLVSLAQLNQLTQMMTPMTVMSPGVQLTPSLTQAQLTSMFASPLLKQFPLGIPSSLIQSGQVLGQPVLKPVVVVSVPNVMTQNSAALPSNTALVTSSL